MTLCCAKQHISHPIVATYTTTETHSTRRSLVVLYFRVHVCVCVWSFVLCVQFFFCVVVFFLTSRFAIVQIKSGENLFVHLLFLMCIGLWFYFCFRFCLIYTNLLWFVLPFPLFVVGCLLASVHFFSHVNCMAVCGGDGLSERARKWEREKTRKWERERGTEIDVTHIMWERARDVFFDLLSDLELSSCRQTALAYLLSWWWFALFVVQTSAAMMQHAIYGFFFAWSSATIVQWNISIGIVSKSIYLSMHQILKCHLNGHLFSGWF